MMEDPDATSPRPFVHWLVANIPPDVTRLPAALPKGDKVKGITGAVQGSNHTSNTGYFGPKPPAADGAHRYHFQVYALDRVLDVPFGADRDQLLAAMNGRVLAKGEVVGTYAQVRKPQK